MALDKLKLSVENILEKLNLLNDEDGISHLDRDYLQNLFRNAYDELLDTPLVKSNSGKNASPSKAENTHIIFEHVEANVKQDEDEKRIATNETVREKEEEHSEKDMANESAPLQRISAESTPELREIFDIKESQELSERLSQMPIDNIWKAMGLNERIFTQNELFKGDLQAFQMIVQQLNQFANFEEARDYLASQVVDKYNWLDDDKRPIAKNFVRLVKRKYA